jgi:DNA-binding transcriptional MerR regulator
MRFDLSKRLLEKPEEVTVGIDLGTPGGDQSAVTVRDTSTGEVVSQMILGPREQNYAAETVQQIMSQPKYYTRADVCATLGMNHSTLARWEQKGWITPANRIGQTCVYTEQQFQEIKTVWQNSSRNVTPEQLCTVCKHRKARAGSTVCSRCSYSQLETQLRSTLPGMETKVDQATLSVPGATSTEQSEEVTICPTCGSDDPSEKKMVVTGPEEFPISVECSDDWHAKMIGINQYAQPVLGAFQPGVKYYNRREVALLIGVSPTTICRWEGKGATPPPFRVAHSNQLFYTEELVQKIKQYATLVEQVRIPSNPIAQAARAVSNKSLSRISEKAVSIKIRGFRRGNLL